MKKLLAALALLTAVSSASAATYVGGSLGYPYANVHYQRDMDSVSATRFGLNLAPFSGFGVGLSADYLHNFNTSSSTLNTFSPYYGFGADVLGYFSNGSFFVAYPHGLVGGKFDFDPRLSAFLELNLGYYISSYSYVHGLGYGTRLGINYRLN